MADIFRREDFKALMTGKRIIFIGDSNMRAIYKDWVWLTQNNSIIPLGGLKAKLEPSFAGDTLLLKSALHNGRDFQEVREYQDESIYLHFIFATKCISDDVQNLFAKFKYGKTPKPDIIIFNSCLWDISRWGPDGVKMYQKNMVTLLEIMRDSLPSETLVLFTTTLPVSLDMRGGFLVPDVDFLKTVIPYDVVEANNFIRDLVVAYECDVVDLHFHLRFQIHRRRDDGVHWEPIVIRHLTNLLLTHISVSFGVKLPGHARSHALSRIHSVESSNLSSRFQSQDSKNNAPFMENSFELHEEHLNNRRGKRSQGSGLTLPQTSNSVERCKRRSLALENKWGFHDNPPINNYNKEQNNLFIHCRDGKRGVWEQQRNGCSRASNYVEPLYPTNQERAQVLLDGCSGRNGYNSRGHRLETDFHMHNQGRNEPDDYFWKQPNNQGVWEQQNTGYSHVIGKHVSNYKEPMHPTYRERFQVLLDPYPEERSEGNHHYSQRYRQKRQSHYKW